MFREIKGDDSFRMLKDELDEREEEGFNYKKLKRRKVVLE